MTLETLGAMLVTHLLIFMLAWLVQDYRYARKEFNRVQRDFSQIRSGGVKEM